MFLPLLAAMTVAQAQAPAPDPVDTLAAPPKLNRTKAILCSCEKTQPPQFMLQGLVVDAEMTLAPDGRNPADRQATIFNIFTATENGERADLGRRLKIFHLTNKARCGVRFDYGKEYMVYARKTEEGAYETDYCLMNAAFDPSSQEAASETPASDAETDPKSE